MMVLPETVPLHVSPPLALTPSELESTMKPTGIAIVADPISCVLTILPQSTAFPEPQLVITTVNGLVILPAATEVGEIVAA